jgi:hypothetical protein
MMNNTNEEKKNYVCGGERVLMVVIVQFEPSIKYEKGHILTSNIELGFELIEFDRLR